MKTSIIVAATALGSLGMMAFGIMNWEDKEPPKTTKKIVATSSCASASAHPVLVHDFFEDRYSNFTYDIGPRFYPITKKELATVTNASYFIVPEERASLTAMENVEMRLVQNDIPVEEKITSTQDPLSQVQRKFLDQLDYSSDFLVYTEYEATNKVTGLVSHKSFEPYMTVVPEEQASYSYGKGALIAFIQNRNKEYTRNLNESKLRPGHLSFVVSQEGMVKNLKLTQSCGNEEIDQNMLHLIHELPGDWTPAKNDQGKEVEQLMVLTFGIVGC